MLSIFPSLLTFGLVGPFLIRITLGLIFIRWAIVHFGRSGKAGATQTASIFRLPIPRGTVIALGIFELLAGIFLVIGLLTQIAAILGILLLIERVILSKKLPVLYPPLKTLYIIMLVSCVAILFMGAGFMAFDLPL